MEIIAGHYILLRWSRRETLFLERGLGFGRGLTSRLQL